MNARNVLAERIAQAAKNAVHGRDMDDDIDEVRAALESIAAEIEVHSNLIADLHRAAAFGDAFLETMK